MRIPIILAIACLAIGAAVLVQPSSGYAQSGSYCDGHRDGHRSGADTFGMGYPGYLGCSGDPGSSGGSASPYQRGFAAGMRDITREMCRQHPTHQNCK